MYRSIILCLFVLINCSILSVNNNKHESSDIIPMVFVEGGQFQMALDPGRPKLKAHPVELSDFYIGKYEVTFNQYDAFCEETQQKKPVDKGWGRGELPVMMVSWYHALDFCNWLSLKQGLTPVYTIDKEKLDTVDKEKYDNIRWSVAVDWSADGYRLPTEAEWEYAARSGGQVESWAGTNREDSLSSVGNFCELNCSNHYKMTTQNDGFQGPAPVGSFQPNALDIYDMSGNLREWCWDRLGDYPKSDSLQLDPKGPDRGPYRIYRGGSYGDLPNWLRCSQRNYYFPYTGTPYKGFRICRSASKKGKRKRQRKKKNSKSTIPKPIKKIDYFIDDSIEEDTIPPKRINIITNQDTTRLVTTFRGHTGAINAAFFSPDGTKVITNSRDNTAKIWDIGGNLLTDIKRHVSSLLDARFSPDGGCIITRSFDGEMNLWDSTGQFIDNLTGSQKQGQALSFSRNSKEILTGSSRGIIKRWNSNGKLLAEWTGHRGTINDICYSPNETMILTCGDDKTAKIWNLDGTLLTEFTDHRERIFTAHFSPDGQYIATGSKDSIGILWDLNGKIISIYDDHSNTVYSCTFFPNNQKIITCSWDNTAKIWDFKGNLLRILDKHYLGVHTATFSPDGLSFLTLAFDNKPKLWDLQGNLLADLNKHTKGVSSSMFSPDSQLIVTSSWDHTAIVWDTKGNIIAKLSGHKAGVSSAVFSPDGKYVLTASWDHTARLWRLA